MDRSESVGCADVQCHCFELETKIDHRSGIPEELLVLIG